MPITRLGALAAMTAAVLLLACGSPAGAVIKVELTVSKMYDMAKAAAVGTVTRVNPNNRIIDVQVSRTLKGERIGDRFRVQLVAPAGLIGRAAPGHPVVLLVGKARGGSVALVHLADAWLLAELIPTVNPPAWRTVGLHKDARGSFPGRTAALVRILTELQAGKATLLNETETDVCRGGVRQLAKLDLAKPIWMLAADVNGDRKPDLLIGMARASQSSTGGVRLFLAAGAGYQDATEQWMPKGERGGAGSRADCYRAFGDVNRDGKVDLLLNETLWLNDGQRLTPAPAKLELSGRAQPLAAALLDLTGDGQPDVLTLAADGQLRAFQNPGSSQKPWPRLGVPNRDTPRLGALAGVPARPLWRDAPAGAQPAFAAFGDWGDDGKPHVIVVSQDGLTRYVIDPAGGPPADFERLTGAPLASHYPTSASAAEPARRDGRSRLAGVTGTTLDVNGDGRRDLFLLAEGGGLGSPIAKNRDWGSLLLVNRGFGCFFVIPGVGRVVTPSKERSLPFKLATGTPWTAADLHGDGHDDLLVLTEDGRLFEVDNPAAAVGPTKIPP